MITTQRRTAILLLQMVMCLLLLVVCRSDHVALQLSCVGNAAHLQLCQQSDNFFIECADVDESTVDCDQVDRSECAIHSNALLQHISSKTGKLYPVEQHNYLPLVYLPVFSPPKINV